METRYVSLSLLKEWSRDIKWSRDIIQKTDKTEFAQRWEFLCSVFELQEENEICGLAAKSRELLSDISRGRYQFCFKNGMTRNEQTKLIGLFGPLLEYRGGLSVSCH